jgi:hypothetical protein
VIRGVVVLAAGLSVVAAQTPPASPIRGLTGDTELARLYDTILNADFDAVPGRLRQTCPPAEPEFCLVLTAVGILWEISLDRDNRRHDARFSAAVEAAISSSETWTQREPARAEAWFALGASYGARAQWRVLRKERVAAARDGKRIKEALERSLALDPAMHDAKFGLGMYRYYAAVAPAALRMLRWLLQLPGGDRADGLRQMVEARTLGRVMRGEAGFQLHLIYQWYEKRPDDALGLVRELQARYPRNPHFYQSEAEILDEYFHDTAAAVAVLEQQIARAQALRVNAPDVASRRARTLLNVINARARR